MVSCCLYNQVNKKDWDNFVTQSRTPLFFFQRDFMEYHADRFTDHSLLFYDEDKKLIALFPACRNDKQLISHGGLTYGGLLLPAKVRTELVLQVVEQLQWYASQQGFNKILYKAIPYIFYEHPAHDDIYALIHRAKAKLIRQDLSSVIRLDRHLGLSKGRKWLIARAKKNNLQITDSTNWDEFYHLLSHTLEKHAATPVHTPVELKLLQNRFPQNIVLKVICEQENMLAATLLFKFKNTIHTQYMAVSDEGKDLGALDYLIASIIGESTKAGFEYFSFGISTEQNGNFLNLGLLSQKESFGARSILLDFYEVNLHEN